MLWLKKRKDCFRNENSPFFLSMDNSNMWLLDEIEKLNNGLYTNLSGSAILCIVFYICVGFLLCYLFFIKQKPFKDLGKVFYASILIFLYLLIFKIAGSILSHKFVKGFHLVENSMHISLYITIGLLFLIIGFLICGACFGNVYFRKNKEKS